MPRLEGGDLARAVDVRWLTLAPALVVTAALVVTGVRPPAADTQETAVHVLVIDGLINPFTERYLVDGLREADQAGVTAVVVRINTPGGLERSMRAP